MKNGRHYTTFPLIDAKVHHVRTRFPKCIRKITVLNSKGLFIDEGGLEIQSTYLSTMRSCEMTWQRGSKKQSLVKPRGACLPSKGF